jgi:predicted amidohydrolase
MSYTVKIAATQMNANPTLLDDRLARAERLVVAAAEAGAKLVALPELFNVGYVYSDENYHRAEPTDGPTTAWMKETAARLGIHLAGTLMLLDQDDVYNALLLVAPDGRTWRYDKTHPWGWERAYFREGHRITVAETELGRIGMMICWDVAHSELWRRYAGRVDMMLVCSCPPNISEVTYHLPGDVDLTLDDLGPVMSLTEGSARQVFGEAFNQQVAWLGVPAVGTGGVGRIRTKVPNGLGSMLSMVPTAPWLIQYLPQASQLELSCEITPACKVVDSDGRVVSALGPEDGEAFTLAEVTLPPQEERSVPVEPQPSPGISRFVYFVSDILLPTLTAPVYRQGLRQERGATMAPVDVSTRHWRVVSAAGAAAGLLLGILIGRRRRS